MRASIRYWDYERILTARRGSTRIAGLCRCRGGRDRNRSRQVILFLEISQSLQRPVITFHIPLPGGSPEKHDREANRTPVNTTLILIPLWIAVRRDAVQIARLLVGGQ